MGILQEGAERNVTWGMACCVKMAEDWGISDCDELGVVRVCWSSCESILGCGGVVSRVWLRSTIEYCGGW